MCKKHLLILLQILLISCGFGKEKFTVEKIKKLFDKTESWQYATSELKEKGRVFSVSNLIDEDTNTCWATRINGGVNEEVLIFFSPPDLDLGEKWQKGIGIINGFSKNKSLYYANNRAKDVEIKLYRMLVDGTSDRILCPRMLFIRSINLIEQTNIKLEDEFGGQSKYYFFTDLENDSKNNKIKFGNITASFFVEYALVLKIKSIYKGSKHNDLCISEIRFLTE